MATLPLFDHTISSVAVSEDATIIARERQKSLMLRAWILSGLFFMALPGTLLGFSNLMAISAHHGLGTLPAAWMEGHGHAQMFGWIGSFILGIGFYSQPGKGRAVLPLSCYIFWTTGVAARWFANMYGWHWRTLLPVSAGFELVAVMLFLFAASHHKRATTGCVSGRIISYQRWGGGLRYGEQPNPGLPAGQPVHHESFDAAGSCGYRAKEFLGGSGESGQAADGFQ